MTTQLNINEAYRAMYFYLENYYKLTQADEIGGMLGSMSFLEDGTVVDPAIWDDWLEAIKMACDPKEKMTLSIEK